MLSALILSILRTFTVSSEPARAVVPVRARRRDRDSNYKNTRY
ncbi:hypothetical protein [Kiloniella litopenaei]